jgi:DNA polymerase I
VCECDKLFSVINFLETTAVEDFQPGTECAILPTQDVKSVVVESSVSLSTFEASCLYIDDPADARRFVLQLSRSKNIIAIDIETYGSLEVLALDLPKPMKKQCGLDPHLSLIRTVQIYPGGDTVYVFDVKALGLDILQPLWEKTFIAHNALFELKHLIHKGAFPRRIGCTMLQANVLFGGLRSLKDLAKEVLNIELSKEQQVSDWSAETLTQEQIEYAALDAVVTRVLFEKQYALIKERNLISIYGLMRDAQPAIAKLELDGVYLNRQEHSGIVDQWRQEFAALETNLRTIIGDINPNSPHQIAAWLEQNLPEKILYKWPKTEKGLLKSDIKTLLLYSQLDVVRPQVAYKEMAKLLSSYGDNFAARISPVTDRIHAHFQLAGAATGRFTCRDPNVQNIPRDKKFRALFCAPAGRKLVVADFSQLELRVAALLSEDPVMLQIYQTGEDLHRKTAAAVLGIDQTDVTKEQRQMAKAVNFGFLFGQKARGFVRYAKTTYGVEMTENEASNAKSVFLKTYERLAVWQQQTIMESRLYNRVRTKTGRVRDFSREKVGNQDGEALNTPVQGSAAEILTASLIRLDKSLEGKDAKIVNIIHDEIVVETQSEISEEVKFILENCMVEGFLDIFPSAKPYIKDLVEAHVGDNWADAKG